MSLEYIVEKPVDLTKINSNNVGELLWWSYTLAVSPESILTTIDKVGYSTAEVRKYLKESEDGPV
ncbi:MAG: DUF3606 domain-containing protein [Segetibacter sp.]